MEQQKLILQYDNNDVVLLNIETERCENKYENSIRDAEKKLFLLSNGNFMVLNVNKKMVHQYIQSKNSPVSFKSVHVVLNVIQCSENDGIILGGDKAGTVYAWNMKTGYLLNSFQAHYGVVKDILLDSSLNVVYTYSEESAIHVYSLNDIIRRTRDVNRKKTNPLLIYQLPINDRIKQIVSISPNMFDPYYSMVCLTECGQMLFFGLKQESPLLVLNLNSTNCSYLCTNQPFHTHLYVCRGKRIHRASLKDLHFGDSDTSREQISNFQKKNKKECSSDYIIIKEDATHVNTSNQEQIMSSSRAYNTFEKESRNHTIHRKVHLQEWTTFDGHKNEIKKCYINDQKRIMISLAKDGIRLWDLYDCCTIKILKYGENIINFYVPTPKVCSYFFEFPNLLMEYEEEHQTTIHLVKEAQPEDYNAGNYNLFLEKDNSLLQMANMFKFHQSC